MTRRISISISSFAIAASILLSSHSLFCEGFATNNINTNKHMLRSSNTALRDSSEGNNNDNGGGGMQRRNVLNNIFRGAAAALAISTTQSASALDFDAFESGEITKDSTPFDSKLNEDEALCKYGAPGKSMGEACKRAKIDRKLPGGVDATGKVDRGDYLACHYEYPVIDNKYVKTRVCKPSGEWASDIK